MITINFQILCPALKEVSREFSQHYEINIDPERESFNTADCLSGGEALVSAVIIGDRMTQARGKVEVNCEGCYFQPDGFTKIVKRKIA